MLVASGRHNPNGVRPHLACRLRESGLNPANRLVLIGAGARNRTADLLITNQLLYQLSYSGRRTWAEVGDQWG